MPRETLAQAHSKRRPLVETVAEEIVAIILEGELRPGDKLNEVEIAQRLGVSRGPVREASRQLQEAGLLEAQAFRGSFVRSLNQREVAEIYGLRTLLETTAIAEATRLATPTDLVSIEHALRETETAALSNAKGRMIESDFAFHTAICAAGHNTRITETFTKLATELRLVHLLMSPEPHRMRAAVKSHAVILEGIKLRRVDRAMSLIRNHLDDERDEVLQYLGPHGGVAAQPPLEPDPEIDGQADAALRGRVKVRGHVRGDFGLLARMNRELADDEGHRNTMTVPELEERFRRFVHKDGWSVDLFTLDDEIIGYATHRYEVDPAQPGGKRVNLRQFYIARHRRRERAGTAAFSALVRARFNAGDRIFLEVIEDNPGGRVFWSRAGFTPYSTIFEYVVDANATSISATTVLPREHGKSRGKTSKAR